MSEVKEVSKAKKILNVCVNVAIGLIVVLALIFTIFGLTSRRSDQIPNVFGQGYLVVLSDSMNTPDDVEAKNIQEGYECPNGFKRGDILTVETYTANDLYKKLLEGDLFEVGDIITFPATINEVLSYNTHRIIKVEYDEVNKTCQYITQGDNTAGPDGYINHLSVLASYEGKVPAVGNVLLFLQSGVGFFVCIVLPLLLLLAYEVFNFVKVYKEYRLEKNGGVDPKAAVASNEDLQKQIEELKRQLEEKNKDEE